MAGTLNDEILRATAKPTVNDGLWAYYNSLGGGDPLFNNVTALLKFDGANGSTTITDVIGTTWTVSGNAQLDTSISKFGGASLKLDGTGDFITAADLTGYEADADFCYESWIYPTNVSSLRWIAAKAGSGSTRDWQFFIGATGKLNLQVYSSAGATLFSIPSATSVPINTFSHVAWSRTNNDYRIFLNGNTENAALGVTGYGTGTAPLVIGRDTANTVRDFAGWIDETRITKGAGASRYTGNFAVPTGPFPTTAGSAGSNYSLPDGERQWLLAQLALPANTVATNNDLWRMLVGPNANLNDALYAYWSTH